MKPSPEELVDQWWQEHSTAVLRYARRRVPPADVEDVVTQTFTVAWRRAEEVPDLVLPWLLGVARRVAANVLRGRDRRDALTAKLVLTHDEGRSSEEDPRAAAVLEALAQLRDRDRELLTLLAWDGLSTEEAAAALHCTQATLRVRLHRARERLRRALADLPPDPPLRTPTAPRPTTRLHGGPA